MTIVQDVTSIFEVINPLMLRLATSIIILLIGFIIGRILSKILYRILHEVELDKGFKKTTGFEFSLENFLTKFTAYFIS